MPYKITYDPGCACIKAWNSGAFDNGVAREIVAEVIRAVSTSDCKRVLIDLRESELALSMTELYSASRIASAAGVPESIKRAVVVAEKDSVAYDFFETVLRNIGKGVRVFTDPDEANRWLME
jgi:hypothetical protein